MSFPKSTNCLSKKQGRDHSTRSLGSARLLVPNVRSSGFSLLGRGAARRLNSKPTLLYYKKYLTYQTSSALMDTTQEAFMTDPLNAQMAREDLQYIRQTLQAAGQFTAVPGKSLMLAGVMALAGVACNLLLTGAPWSRGASPALALDSWGLVLGISVAIVSYGI